MRIVGSSTCFNGKQIVVDFDPSIGDARLVDAGIRQLVRRLQNRHASEEELVAAIPRFVGDYCLATRLVSRTTKVIEFAVAFRG